LKESKVRSINSNFPQIGGRTVKKILIVVFFLIFAECAFASDGFLRIGVVLSIGGLGDKAFNDAVYEGIQKIRKAGNCAVDVVEPSDVAAIEPSLEYLSGRKLDVIVAVGLFANDAVRKVAARHPEQRYALLDSVVTAPNVLSIIFNEEEGSFFAGSLAGLLTKTQKVGFLGGMNSPVIAAFEKGFRNGLHFVNPDAELVCRYAGDTPEAFGVPEAGKKIGFEIAAAGADLIYHAAGGTGLGLIEAARQGKFLVIGVDSDQSSLAPGRVVASMVKRLDVALDKIVKMLRAGTFQGKVLTLGLADAGVELALSKYNKSLLTPLITDRLKEIQDFLLQHCKTTSP